MSTPVKFVHLRKYPGGSLFAGRDSLLHHASAKGGATLAFQVNEDGTVSVGIAKCSNNDHYVKSIGRNLAASRLGQFTFPKGFDTYMFEGNFSELLVHGV